MDTIEFNTKLRNDGTIAVPEEYRSVLSKRELIHVKVEPVPARRPRRDDEDAISYYLENPIIIPEVKAPSREELYKGR